MSVGKRIFPPFSNIGLNNKQLEGVKTFLTILSIRDLLLTVLGVRITPVTVSCVYHNCFNFNNSHVENRGNYYGFNYNRH